MSKVTRKDSVGNKRKTRKTVDPLHKGMEYLFTRDM